MTLMGPRRPKTLAELSEIERAQLAVLGGRVDAEGLEIWKLVDDSGTALFDVWTTGVDSGGVLRAGTTDLVGEIVQFGFACNDLAAWHALATARFERDEPSFLADIDLSLPLDTALELYAVAPATVAALRADPTARLDVARVTLDASWRGLAVILAPHDDGDGSLRRLLHGASPHRLPGVTFAFGAPGYFDADQVRAIDALLAAVPPSAIADAAPALAALADADAWTAEDYAKRLERLRAFVAGARAAGASLLTAVQ